MYCLLLTVHGSRISRIGSNPCALMIKFFTSLFSHNKPSWSIVSECPMAK